MNKNWTYCKTRHKNTPRSWTQTLREKQVQYTLSKLGLTFCLSKYDWPKIRGQFFFKGLTFGDLWNISRDRNYFVWISRRRDLVYFGGGGCAARF